MQATNARRIVGHGIRTQYANNDESGQYFHREAFKIFETFGRG